MLHPLIIWPWRSPVRERNRSNGHSVRNALCELCDMIKQTKLVHYICDRACSISPAESVAVGLYEKDDGGGKSGR